MKVIISDLLPGDVIYSFGAYLIVGKISLKNQSVYCTNLSTHNFVVVTSPFVTLITRQLLSF